MKKIVILACCILLLLTGCNFDPYSNQRPVDYGDALWVCDEYNMWFCVDLEKEDYYDPEGELQINDNTYFCKFYFIHQTNQLHINIYPLEYAAITDEARDRNSAVGSIEGECNFSNELFVLTIDTISGNIFDGTIKEMTFHKTETSCE